MTPSDQPETPGRVHGAVIGLIFVILLLTLLAVGVVVATARTSPATKDYAAACKAQVQDAVLAGAREITRTCAQTSETPTSTAVAAQDGQIGFSYPLGWSAVGTWNRQEPVFWNAQIMPGFINQCDGCDGPFPDISLFVGQKSEPAIVAQKTFSDYVTAQYTGDGYTGVVIKTSTQGTGTLYTVTGAMAGMITGPFEAVIYEGATEWASATFLDKDTTKTDTNEAWTLVKGSLDFSKIK